jgi:hypothetical protein
MTQIIPKPRLKKWARKKFHEQCATLDLLASVEDMADRAAIAIVALLEVKPEIRYQGMRVDEASYMKSCHAYVAGLKMEWDIQ